MRVGLKELIQISPMQSELSDENDLAFVIPWENGRGR
jgi:hypothetical protein